MSSGWTCTPRRGQRYPAVRRRPQVLPPRPGLQHRIQQQDHRPALPTAPLSSRRHTDPCVDNTAQRPEPSPSQRPSAMGRGRRTAWTMNLSIRRPFPSRRQQRRQLPGRDRWSWDSAHPPDLRVMVAMDGDGVQRLIGPLTVGFIVRPDAPSSAADRRLASVGSNAGWWVGVSMNRQMITSSILGSSVLRSSGSVVTSVGQHGSPNRRHRRGRHQPRVARNLKRSSLFQSRPIPGCGPGPLRQG